MELVHQIVKVPSQLAVKTYVDNNGGSWTNMKLAYIDELYASKSSPSYFNALHYDMWKTREIKTSSGIFTVPTGVYYLGVACVGKGGDVPSTGSECRSGGGGGGLTFLLKKVTPGQQIPYTISGGVASCDGATANFGANGITSSTGPITGGVGGTASGGDYNYSGGNGGAATINSMGYYAFAGGGGAGGGAGGMSSSGQSYRSLSGGGGGRAFPDNTTWTPGNGGDSWPSNSSDAFGGGGSPRFNGVSVAPNIGASTAGPGAGLGSTGFLSVGSSTIITITRTGKGINPFSISKLGLCTITDTLIENRGWSATEDMLSGFSLESYPFGNACMSNCDPTKIIPSFGGAGSGNQANGICGFGGGSGGSQNLSAGAGVLGGAGGQVTYLNTPGYGGGAGAGLNAGATGGAAVVIFIY